MISDFEELLLELPLVGALATRTKNFRQRRHRLWNFTCPYPDCGDDAHSKSRARGYVYEHEHKLKYKCHNCGRSQYFTTLLKEQFGDLYRELLFQRARSTGNSNPSYLASDETNVVAPSKRPRTENEFEWTPIAKLSPAHYARKYVEGRKIPQARWSDLYFVEDFATFANSVVPRSFKQKRSEPRLVLPFRDEKGHIIAFTGRSFDPHAGHYKYLTIRIDDSATRVFRLNEVNAAEDFVVVEGPIDSLFFDNAIAVSGAKLDVPEIVRDHPARAILVADNEPRNHQVVSNIEKYLEGGFRVFLWPVGWPYKDVNEAVQAGVSPSTLKQMILDGSTRGLAGKVQLTFWRKDDRSFELRPNRDQRSHRER